MERLIEESRQSIPKPTQQDFPIDLFLQNEIRVPVSRFDINVTLNKRRYTILQTLNSKYVLIANNLLCFSITGRALLKRHQRRQLKINQGKIQPTPFDVNEVASTQTEIPILERESDLSAIDPKTISILTFKKLVAKEM